MEKKIYLGLSLILGVPILRVIEIVAIGLTMGGLSAANFVGHATLGLIIGVACAISVQVLKLRPAKMLWVLPLLAVAYAGLLLGVSYPPTFFKLDPTYVSTMILMDLGAWAIVVAGASTVAFMTTRTRSVASPRLGRAIGTR
ncbi:hypothetical protein [Fimbriimonas ginsengisoli]|uniref:Uncharacterized protein n=1 Tax=Fimbriimonas ginsengisoli Gsoil 348 TaxID=661478 RepID=A0A068NUW2_FIMGI|nr:hypothetical protein [Fimbriimonas ginsengisoli]AIE85394.1 hypothetical protein OP10G_2026 [Fimbriimonas ginsengisoli Gsoil 348]